MECANQHFLAIGRLWDFFGFFWMQLGRHVSEYRVPHLEVVVNMVYVADALIGTDWPVCGVSDGSLARCPQRQHGDASVCRRQIRQRAADL